MIRGGDTDYSRWGVTIMPDDKSQSRRIYVGLQEGVCTVSGRGIPGFPVKSLPWLTHQLGYLPAPWLEG